MHRRIRGVILAATLGLAGVVAVGQPALAATQYGCPDQFVCAYQNAHFNGRVPGSAATDFIHVSELYDCREAHFDGEGWTSFYNNTRFKFELWDTDWVDEHAGTMAPYKGYGYLADWSNDIVDTVISPNCGGPA